MKERTTYTAIAPPSQRHRTARITRAACRPERSHGGSSDAAGYVAGDLGHFVGALAASDTTLQLARHSGLPALESTALRTGGAALRAMGRLDEARERIRCRRSR